MKVKETVKAAISFYFRFILFNKPKIFCISFQRTGTTSVGKFFSEHGYRVATYPISRKNNWTLKWFSGDYEKIFSSLDFKSNQVFEDDPWWCQDFYKVLFHRFPDSKFILLERDADKWFDSMLNHSNNRSLGNTYRHSKIYRRELEFYKSNFEISRLYNTKIDNLLPLTENHREHYKEIYYLRIQEVKEFFNEFDPDKLFYSRLENHDKWRNMGSFFGIKVSDDYEVHANKTMKVSDDYEVHANKTMSNK